MMTNLTTRRVFKRFGFRVQRNPSRGNVYRVMSDWRGILDFRYHAFYISIEEGEQIIRYVISPRIGSFGGVSEQWLRLGSGKPEHYSAFLKRHGWKQFNSEAETLRYVREKLYVDAQP